MVEMSLPPVPHRSADYDLDPEILRALWTMEERHFWHAARNRWIERALRDRGGRPGWRVLDVGCGSGAVARHLHARGLHVTGIDTADVQIAKAAARCPGATFLTGRVEDLPRREPFDVLVFGDVLEHLHEPLALVQAALAHARRGAVVLATVPGLRSLFSVVDELAGHKRRYEPGELAALLRGAGLVDVEERGIFRVMLPALRARRPRAAPPGAVEDVDYRRAVMIADMRVPWAPLNAAGDLLCRLEARLGFGTALDRRGPTLLATAQVPGT
jgi:SAM-dependent methyltransferase